MFNAKAGRPQVELGTISVITEIYAGKKVTTQYESREHKKRLLEPLTEAVMQHFKEKE